MFACGMFGKQLAQYPEPFANQVASAIVEI
jgi:hypothetical protein